MYNDGIAVFEYDPLTIAEEDLYVFVVDYVHRDRFARNAVVVCGNGTVLKKSSTVLTSTPKADRTLSVMSESDAIQYMVAGGR